MRTVADKRRNASSDMGNVGFKMRQLPFMVVIFTVMLYIVHRTTKYQYYETEIETKLHPFETVEDNELPSRILTDLAHGIMQPRSDLELKLWSKNSRSENPNILTKWVNLLSPGGTMFRICGGNGSRVLQSCLGDRTKNVVVIDREYNVHKGIQTLGGTGELPLRKSRKSGRASSRASKFDPRAEANKSFALKLAQFAIDSQAIHMGT
ncbi:hypothetical protein F3Y22_tig00110383pilonHSYRG00112 [Hibiscus syriacus]|uniref:Uncharacterized protein n=1 Tax=Hibiscus syriacus TaxID=106335 RepID=A0A6A3AS38_HIBSY|nr:hypothetical protein F3Y22_tig00110383pilonHSYRG00112 [Hibiscus syriacus]